jgi:hypothetical protein
MKDKLIYPAYYFLLKAVLGAIGFILFTSKNFSMISNLSFNGQLIFLIGDYGLFKDTYVLPIIIVALCFIAFAGIRKKMAWAGMLGAIILIIDIFSFPVGTIISLIVIIYMFIHRKEFSPLPKKTVMYRVVGLSIIAFSIIGFVITSGLMADYGIQEQTIEPMSKIELQSLAEIEGKVEVVVSFSTPVGTQDAAQAQQAFIQDVEMMGGVILSSTFFAETTVTVIVDADQLINLAYSPDVKYIVPNEEVWFAPQDSQVDIQSSLANAYSYLNVEPLWKAGVTGEGVVVAVVDTGINSKLPAFQRDGKSIVIDAYQLYGEYVMWHGTAVATCVASQDENIRGTAPGVDLLNVEVFQPNGGARIADILSGWEWVARWKARNNRPVICVNSLGAHPLSAGKNLLEDAANNMVIVHNIPMIVASGNQVMGGPFAEFPLMVNVPGTAKNVLTVGAIDSNKNVAHFSCYMNSKKPDVMAPGVNIKMFDEYGRPRTASGTSFATPFVAGAVALVYQMNPSHSAIQIQDAFKNGAKDMGMPGVDDDSGYGIADAYTASQVIQGVAPESKITSSVNVFIILPVLGFIILLIPEISSKKYL